MYGLFLGEFDHLNSNGDIDLSLNLGLLLVFAIMTEEGLLFEFAHIYLEVLLLKVEVGLVFVLHGLGVLG